MRRVVWTGNGFDDVLAKVELLDICAGLEAIRASILSDFPNPIESAKIPPRNCGGGGSCWYPVMVFLYLMQSVIPNKRIPRWNAQRLTLRPGFPFPDILIRTFECPTLFPSHHESQGLFLVTTQDVSSK